MRTLAVVAEDVQEIIQAAIAEHDTTGDDDDEEEYEEGGDSTDDFEQLDLETDKSGKVRTIKKHSKVNIKINKQLAHRPNVEDIEWEVTPVVASDDQGEQPEVVTKEISSVNLEDVSNDRRYSLDRMDPSPGSLRVDAGRMFESPSRHRVKVNRKPSRL